MGIHLMQPRFPLGSTYATPGALALGVDLSPTCAGTTAATGARNSAPRTSRRTRHALKSTAPAC
jgi:hypothetical protein